MNLIKRVYFLKQAIEKNKRGNEEHLLLIDDYLENITKITKEHDNLVFTLKVLGCAIVLSATSSFIFSNLISFSLTGGFVFLFIGFFIMDFQSSKQNVSKYTQILEKLSNNGINDLLAFKIKQKELLEKMESEVRDIKGNMGINEYSQLIENKNELNNEEFELLERWFLNFDEQNREQRGKRMDIKMKETIDSYNTLEHS